MTHPNRHRRGKAVFIGEDIEARLKRVAEARGIGRHRLAALLIEQGLVAIEIGPTSAGDYSTVNVAPQFVSQAQDRIDERAALDVAPMTAAEREEALAKIDQMVERGDIVEPDLQEPFATPTGFPMGMSAEEYYALNPSPAQLAENQKVMDEIAKESRQ